ncbi:MAG: nucleotide exchange factor GrpE [Candidatus Ancillula sp.]|jgi:molecular chaperone GrpE|nr:nucleotide exchange factor GrpE [Candidatus Ancillula sp.]
MADENKSENDQKVEDLLNEAGLDQETAEKIEKEAKEDDESIESSDQDNSNSEVESLKSALARERADFINYKKRSQKEQEAARSLGKTAAILNFLPVMDEIHRAKEQGELEEGSPFWKIADKFEKALESLGVTKYAEKGEEFDPNLHDALMNRDANENDDLEDGQTKVDNVVEHGYKLNDEVFRPAKVTTVSK